MVPVPSLPYSQARFLCTFRGPVGLYSPGHPELCKLHQPASQPHPDMGKVEAEYLQALEAELS